MNAPDEIYINPEIELEDGIQPWLYTPFNRYSIPYIRKDALLEWAKERLHHYAQHDDDAVCWGQRNAFQQVIDKINSL